MRVVLVKETPRSLDGDRQIVLGLGLECTAADCVGAADLEVRLAQVPAELVIVFVGPVPSQALPAIDKAREVLSCPVLVVGPADTPSAEIVNLLHAGAQKFLDRDRFREELQVALEHLQRIGALKIKQGRTIAVTAVNPGSGVTTVAANLAVALAQHHPEKVALAELGNTVPELALMLDLACAYNLSEMVRDWERMDATMMRQSMVAHASGAVVLAYPQETLAPVPLPPPVMRQFVTLLRGLFEFSILDLGYAATDSAVQAMALADEVVVVVRLEVPSLRLTRLFLRNLVGMGIPAEKLRLVANRYGQRGQFPWKQAQGVLELPILTWLPDDPGGLNRALTEGQPLLQVAGGSLVRRFKDLAKRLNGTMTSARKQRT